MWEDSETSPFSLKAKCPPVWQCFGREFDWVTQRFIGVALFFRLFSLLFFSCFLFSFVSPMVYFCFSCFSGCFWAFHCLPLEPLFRLCALCKPPSKRRHGGDASLRPAPGQAQDRVQICAKSKSWAWAWLKIKQGLRRCWSMFPLTRVPFWHRFFEPQPCVGPKIQKISRRKKLLVPILTHTQTGKWNHWVGV